MSKSYWLLGIFLFLTACNEIETPDGRVPDNMVSEAQKWMGTYSGEYNSKSAQLEIQLTQQKPTVLFRDANGNTDILGESCRSRIGDMKKLKASEVTQGQYELDYVVFKFDPGLCASSVVGRDVTLVFARVAQGVRVRLELLKDQYIRPGRVDCSPRMGCEPLPDEVVSTYLTGEFFR